jgi:Protein of unknown function (DUF3467)
MTPPDPMEPELRLVVPTDQAAGVWANLALAKETPHEITLDFFRTDPHVPRAMLVARVAISPILLVRLIQLLEEIWQTWTRRQLPDEGPNET